MQLPILYTQITMFLPIAFIGTSPNSEGFNVNESLGLLKLANTVLILINPSPSNFKVVNNSPS